MQGHLIVFTQSSSAPQTPAPEQCPCQPSPPEDWDGKIHLPLDRNKDIASLIFKPQTSRIRYSFSIDFSGIWYFVMYFTTQFSIFPVQTAWLTELMTLVWPTKRDRILQPWCLLSVWPWVHSLKFGWMGNKSGTSFPPDLSHGNWDNGCEVWRILHLSYLLPSSILNSGTPLWSKFHAQFQDNLYLNWLNVL